ncbi:hypothetical protein GGS21DRAFT_178969 [Xylaria nigripes]|nr:hypothetical protein GGS21DRAFT_178969 [Xylaria nigripes]
MTSQLYRVCEYRHWVQLHYLGTYLYLTLHTTSHLITSYLPFGITYLPIYPPVNQKKKKKKKNIVPHHLHIGNPLIKFRFHIFFRLTYFPSFNPPVLLYPAFLMSLHHTMPIVPP